MNETATGLAAGLAALVFLSVVAMGFAISGTAVAQAADELTFSDQDLADDGTVTVEDVSTSQPSTVVVTYTDGSEEVVAGVVSADQLAHEDVRVEIQDAGGFPGEHTAWVFDDEDLPDDLGIGDDATPVAGAALDSESAAVTQPAEDELTFTDQGLGDDGTVTVEDVRTAQQSTVVVTYTDGSEEVVAGVAGANNLDGEDVSVAIQDAGGFPGEHTAWVFDNADLPDDLGIGDDATPVAGDALDSASADVTQPAEGELTFTAQELADDGSVTVEDVSTGQASTVVVTYTDRNKEIIAGVAGADDLDSEDVSVTVQDTGGFPGEHTAWVFDDDDLPADLGIGDDATPVAGDALDSESAPVSEPSAGDLAFVNQNLGGDGTVTVEEVSTSQPSTVVVTYTDGGEEVVAGVASADNLDSDNVGVAIQDAGGFPGTHTAWVFDDADLPADVGIGDDATPVAGAALDSESALVTEADRSSGGGTSTGQAGTGELAFADQELADDGTVTVEDVSTSQASTVVVTYTDGDEEIVAGVAPADNLDGEDVSVTVQDAGGFPGEHTAWVFDDADLPADLGIGDDATPVADAALDSETASVTEAMSPDGETDGSGTDDGETTEDDSSEDDGADDGGPGFGIVVAVVAVVAGALVALKRRS